MNPHIEVEIKRQVDGSAFFRAVAKDGGPHGKVLASYSLKVPLSARKKYGDAAFIDDVEISIKEHLKDIFSKKGP